MNNVVGSSSVALDGGRPKCRLEECAFGNFVTDAMAAEMDVKIALINSGAIKGSFRAGFNFFFCLNILQTISQSIEVCDKVRMLCHLGSPV